MTLVDSLDTLWLMGGEKRGGRGGEREVHSTPHSIPCVHVHIPGRLLFFLFEKVLKELQDGTVCITLHVHEFGWFCSNPVLARDGEEARDSV